MAREMKDSGIEWIGEIPAEWKVLPAQRGFKEVKTKNTDGAVQNALQFKFGEIIPKKNFDADSDDYVADTITNYTIVEPGIVMINGLNLNYDFKTLRTGLVKEKGVITSAYLALKPNQDLILPEYATYLFKGYETRMALHNMGSGIRLTLGFKELKKQPVLFPSIDEQKRIIAFLDEANAEIDSVIDQTRASIEEYKKLKQAVITQAVTKGIRPDRQLKDSGIEWIGAIPVNYSVERIKHLGNYRNGLTYAPEDIVDEEFGTLVLRSSNIQQGRLCFEDNVYVDSVIPERLMVQKDDIIICSRNGSRELIGKCAIVEEDIKASFGAFMMSFRGKTPKYMYYILNSNVFKYYLSTFLTSTINQLTGSNFGNMAVVWCDDQIEQAEIVEYLDHKTAEFDLLIQKKEQLLSSLESYKKSLIYEYVTGKKEVPA